MKFEKIVLTTNGILLSSNEFNYLEMFENGLTHLNVSIHNEKEFISIESMQKLYDSIKSVYPDAKIRINTNIWKGNHDNLTDLIEWVMRFMYCSDSVRVSNLIYKDSFSVNSVNNSGAETMILSDQEYNDLFDSYIEYYSGYLTCIDNSNALGFVDYIMIPLRSAVIINRNIDSKVSDLLS